MTIVKFQVDVELGRLLNGKPRCEGLDRRASDAAALAQRLSLLICDIVAISGLELAKVLVNELLLVCAALHDGIVVLVLVLVLHHAVEAHQLVMLLQQLTVLQTSHIWQVNGQGGCTLDISSITLVHHGVIIRPFLKQQLAHLLLKRGRILRDAFAGDCGLLRRLEVRLHKVNRTANQTIDLGGALL